MGNRNYIGGHTIIGPHTPDWFGDGKGEACEGAERTRLLKAKERYEELCREGEEGRTGSAFRKELKAAHRELEAAERALKAIGRKVVITPEAEQEIASLRRHVAGLAVQAQAAVRLHEAERARLEELLVRSNLAIERYPEAGKLKL